MESNTTELPNEIYFSNSIVTLVSKLDTIQIVNKMDP